QAASAGDPPPPAAVTQDQMLRKFLFHGFPFLFSCIRWVSTTRLLVPVVATLSILPLLAFTTLRSTGLRVLVGGGTIAILGSLLLFGTPGVYSNSLYTGYWGFALLPGVIAWAPLGLRVVRELRREE